MGIPENRDVNAVIGIVKSTNVGAYVPKKIKVQTPEEAKEAAANNQ